MSAFFRLGLKAAEAGWLPDWMIRRAIRQIVATRSRELLEMDCEVKQLMMSQFIEECQRSPIALAPVESNRQHYSVPTEFFQHVLGNRMKYSSCFWSDTTKTLDEAEELALQTTCERAELQDGQRILELGCGWGSLSLWMAEHYPNANITVVSHSASQKEYITALAEAAGYRNLKVVTSDINQFMPEGQFDRIVSVEMFEHVRNHQELFRRIASWLRDEGKLFVHVFCHREQAYPYESRGPEDWMTDYFFTGGMMPSDQLFSQYQRDLRLTQHWRWNGKHYAKTSNAWLERQDAQRDVIMPVMKRIYGERLAGIWFQRWRMFFMSCAEMFGFHEGNEWWVAHYLFEKQAAAVSTRVAMAVHGEPAVSGRRESWLK
ncbi:MAG: cyclopropane-fatty-acyl-phospholipid synthase family protein [Gemmatales bacterium]